MRWFHSAKDALIEELREQVRALREENGHLVALVESLTADKKQDPVKGPNVPTEKPKFRSVQIQKWLREQSMASLKRSRQATGSRVAEPSSAPPPMPGNDAKAE